MAVNEARPMSRWLAIVLVIAYVVTGVFQPIILDAISLFGGASKEAFLFPIPNSLGMALLLPLPAKDAFHSRTDSLWLFPRDIFVMTLIDVFATTLTLFGQLMIGSGLYIIIYSSLTIWSAIGSRILLKRKMSVWMWLSIGVVTVGLMVSGVGALTSFGADKLVGMLITLVGTILHSCVYWVSEYFCLATERPIHSRHLAGFMGIFGVSIFLSYTLAETVPRWEALFVEPVHDKQGNYLYIFLLYLLLILFDWVHLYAQFTAVVSVGAVMVGVNKAISSVGVFVISHFTFCKVESANCIDVYKICSLVLVVSGVVCYTLASNRYKKRLEKQAQAQQPQEETEHSLQPVTSSTSLASVESTEHLSIDLR
ncbi:hypothetical protein GMRT_15098 [Giardia muris]|uniref:Uncharacterized protein n=1 Tax=Giardia muris TaxID=5742 RepID=A0A4Z1T3I3_GIAMU|nr:hypothetical protein GMRT_15098 [Giardia muris]|eukprot:TNJ26971.1 hypothetical protein GMRT_15098 [Giardia muris]